MSAEKKRKRFAILAIVFGLIAVGLGVAVTMWNKPHEKVEDAEGIKITATALCAEYAADETAANAKYLNKALAVSGKVGGTTTNQDGATVVSLQGASEEATVQCTMRDKNIALANGQEVTMKGFCSGNTMFDVLLTDCIVE